LKYIKSQTGNTLLFAIMVLMLGSVIALTLIGMSINGTARNEHRENYNQAKKNAESGIEHLIASMEKDLESIIPSPGINPTFSLNNFKESYKKDILGKYKCSSKNFIHNEDGKTNYSTCIEYNDNDIEKLLDKNNFYVPITIRSTGIANDEEKEIIAKAKFGATYKNYPSFLDFAVATHPSTVSKGDPNFQSESIIFNGGLQIKGNVFTNGNIAVSNRAYAPIIDANNVGNPWKETTYPEITGFNGKPAEIYLNTDKSLFEMKKYEFDGNCKRSKEVNGLIKSLGDLMDALGDIPQGLINLVSIITFGNFNIPDRYFTYYDLQVYNFDEHKTDDDKCFYKKQSIEEINSFLTGKSNVKIKNTVKELESVAIAGDNSFITNGKDNVLKIVNQNGKVLNGLQYINPKNNNYNVKNGNILLIDKTLKGTSYITTTQSSIDTINTSITKDVIKLLDQLVPIVGLGSHLEKLLNGDSDSFLLDLVNDLVHLILQILGLADNETNGLEGQYYIHNNNEQKKLVIELLKGLGLLSSSQNPDETRLLDFLLDNEGLIQKGKAINLDPGLLGSNDFNLNGVYYIDGDVRIFNSKVNGNAILFVNGNVDIKDSQLNNKNDNNKILIFATGDIIYQYSSERGSQITKSYSNDNSFVVNAFLYSDKKIELHGTVSKFHIKGGIAANQVILSGVRGDVDKILFGPNLFKNPKDESKPSRLIIEHDPKVWETFVKLTKDYSTMPEYHEFFLEPTTITSRK